MNKLSILGALVCTILMTQTGFAAELIDNSASQATNASTQNSILNQSGRGSYAFQDSNYAYSQGSSCSAAPAAQGSCGAAAAPAGGEAACPAERELSECYCLCVSYKPCYYNDWRCVDEPYCTTKRCCRQVPQYYEVTRCRYVPQYYTEKQCRQVPEYYDVQEQHTRKKWICDKKVKYVPQYHWKHSGCAEKAEVIDGGCVGSYEAGSQGSSCGCGN